MGVVRRKKGITMFSMKNARKKKDVAITGLMAKWYNKNSLTRLSEFVKVADVIAAKATQGSKILEIAPGPGYLSIELAKRGYDVSGVELSADFVEIEKKNAIENGVKVDFQQGNAASLPHPDGTFDFLVCMAAFKNFSEPQTALDEMYRVLKPEGTALVIDMNRENTKADIEEAMMDHTEMKGFDRWFVKMSFKTFLKKGAYSQRELEGFISRTMFQKHEIIKQGVGFFIWLYK
jgi:ubiquinone/menaquinone biosynthesis C-methylase UbiE